MPWIQLPNRISLSMGTKMSSPQTLLSLCGSSCTRKLLSDPPSASQIRIGPDKFYKRKSQEKHFTLRREFSNFPACLLERGCFLPSAPWTRFVAQLITAVWIFSISGFHRVS
jgi:hypothetical protein